MNNALFQAVCEAFRIESREDLLEKIKTTNPMQLMERPDAHATLRMLRQLADQWPESVDRVRVIGRRCEERLVLGGERHQCTRKMGHHEAHDFTV